MMVPPTPGTCRRAEPGRMQRQGRSPFHAGKFSPVPAVPAAARLAAMDGRIRWRMRWLLVLAAAWMAGGCFHSDAHRSGVTEEGKPWSERVADRVSDEYIDEL